MIKCLKNLLSAVLSFSLIFTPLYAYSQLQESSESSRPEELIQWMAGQSVNEPLPKEFQEASRIFKEMGDSLEKGVFKEYLEDHPQLVDHFDILSLRNQTAGIVNEISGEIKSSIDFNVYTHQSYPTIIKNIEVVFPEAQPVLTFRGVTVQGDSKRQKEIGVVHTFKGVKKQDVIDWAYDRDILAVLHKKKGLILYHMIFAKNVLGEAPIPSITIPVHSGLLKRDLKLEFIDRSVEPPRRPSRSSGKTAFNKEGEPFYSAGNLLISYTSAQGEKKISKIFSRSGDLYKALFSKYVILDFLLQTVVLQIKSFKEAEDASLNIYYLKEQSEAALLSSILSSVLNRGSLRFLKERSNHILSSKIFLLSHLNTDVFSHNMWLKDYKTLSRSLEDLSNNTQKFSGETVPSMKMAGILDRPADTGQNTDKSVDNNWKSRLKNKYPKAFHFLSQISGLKADIFTAFSAGALAFMHAKSVPYVEGDMVSLPHTAYNIVFFGAVLLLFVWRTAHHSIWFLEKLERVLPRGAFKTKVNQAIEKWKDQSTSARLVGAGFKFAAQLLYAFWLRIAKWSGKPHFFPVIASGLKLGQKITPESEEGRQARLKQTQSLGVSGWHWSSTTNKYKDHEKIIDIVVSRNEKIQSLSRILAYYALSGRRFTPSSLLSGIVPFGAADNLEKIHSNKQLERDFMWVSDKLKVYIENSDRVSSNQSVLELDPEILRGYYRKSLELAADARGRSSLQRDIYSFGAAVMKKLRKGLLWNSEQSKVLSRHTPNLEVADLFSAQLIMDHLTLAVFPLTPLTPRGDYFAGNIHNLGVDNSPSYLFSSPPHFHEGVVNIGIHLVISARNQLQSLGVRESLLKAFEEVGSLYEPVENHRSHDNSQGLTSYLWDFAKYPFASWGLKYKEGTDSQERLDIGDRIWNYQKLTYRFVQVSFTIMLLSRLLFTDSTLLSALIGTFYFLAGGFIYYGWPQIWMTIQHLAYSKKRLETKQTINRVYVILDKIKNNLYSSESELIQEYKEVLESFKKLYSSSKASAKSMDLEPLTQAVQSFVKELNLSEEQKVHLENRLKESSSEDKIQEIKKMVSLLKNPNLPTVNNKVGLSLIALLTLGIFSNIAFVFLSVDSFSDPSLTSAVVLFTATLAGLWTASKVTDKKLTDRFRVNRSLGADVSQIEKGGRIRQAVHSAFSAVKETCQSSFVRRQKARQ